MKNPATPALRKLQRQVTDYDDNSGKRKREWLDTLERRRLARAADVLHLHEALCFLRAYPDDAELLEQVERMLARFDRRGDLRTHRRVLINSGVAGTEIQFAFFAPSASWLARKWGGQLTIDWRAFERKDRLEPLLPLLGLYCETPGLDEFDFGLRGWLDRMKGPAETDAAFLLRRLEQLHMSPITRETLLDELDIPLRLVSGPDTPARTREKYADVPIAYQTCPLARARPAMPKAAYQRPRSVRALSPREGRALVDLARSAMATRSRDLDAFAYGDENDVRLIDCGQGLQFAFIGMIPERRLLLESVYGYLMLKNGVPVGYGASTCLFRSCEMAYTVFDTFRSGEAATMFVWALAITRHLFGVDTFTIDPYQLGQDNDDALHSGAWWFYQKLGFQPREPELRRIVRRELKRMKAKRSYRSSIATLKKLAEANLFLHLGRPRDDVLGVLPLANIGLRITDCLAERFGHDRAKATRTCAREAGRKLGVRSLRGWSRGERLTWDRWGPLIAILPNIDRWSHQQKRALVDVVRAKGGRRESEYVRRFDQHGRLRRAIRARAGAV